MTISVAFANNRERRPPSVSKCQQRKHYSFNVDDTEDVQEGDILDLDGYNNKVRVVKTLGVEYEYYNMRTGELSNEYTSTNQRPIKRIKLDSRDETVVYATKK